MNFPGGVGPHLISEDNFPFIERFQACDAAQDGGLTGTGRAEENSDLRRRVQLQ
jgi:hypothetical protein